MLETASSHKLLLSLLSDQPNIADKVCHTVHNRPKEKCLGESQYAQYKKEDQ